jgi:hypothetical protein
MSFSNSSGRLAGESPFIIRVWTSVCMASKTHVGRACQLSPAMKVTPFSELADILGVFTNHVQALLECMVRNFQYVTLITPKY